MAEPRADDVRTATQEWATSTSRAQISSACARENGSTTRHARCTGMAAPAHGGLTRMCASGASQIINFTLGLLQNRELRKNGQTPRVHFHSTFFYNKLYADSGEYSYRAVQRFVAAVRPACCVLPPPELSPHAQLDDGEAPRVLHPRLRPGDCSSAPGTCIAPTDMRSSRAYSYLPGRATCAVHP